MKLKNVLIVVKDIEKSRQFYKDLIGLDLVLDNGGNMILTEGLVLQEEKIWKKFLEKEIIPGRGFKDRNRKVREQGSYLNPCRQAGYCYR